MFFLFSFSLGIANEEKRSLAQRCERWKNKFKRSSQEKDLVCEVAEKDKAVLSKKIKALKTKCVNRKKIIQVKEYLIEKNIASFVTVHEAALLTYL